MDGSLVSNIRGNAGFFSNFLMFCDNLEYCDRNNLKPILTMKGPWFYNKHSDFDIWSLIFEPLNDGIVEGPIKYAKDFGHFGLWHEQFCCHLGKCPIWDLHNNPELCTENRVLVNRVAKKMKPVSKIQNIIDNFYVKNFENKKVLGLHCRTTDYSFYNLSEYEKYFSSSEFDVIFVASDSQEAIEYFKNKYENVVSYETEIRMSKMNMGVLPRFLEESQKIKHVEDVVVESYLLSKCNHIICINSNVAASALYINPSIPFNLIHRFHDGG